MASDAPPASCDGCGRRAWCRLTSWRERGRVIGKFLCDACRVAIPNEERGWGRDPGPKGDGDG